MFEMFRKSKEETKKNEKWKFKTPTPKAAGIKGSMMPRSLLGIKRK